VFGCNETKTEYKGKIMLRIIMVRECGEVTIAGRSVGQRCGWKERGWYSWYQERGSEKKEKTGGYCPT